MLQTELPQLVPSTPVETTLSLPLAAFPTKIEKLLVPSVHLQMSN